MSDNVYQQVLELENDRDEWQRRAEVAEQATFNAVAAMRAHALRAELAERVCEALRYSADSYYFLACQDDVLLKAWKAAR
jgi:hypothetical protein